MSFIYEDKELLKLLEKVAQVEPRAADIDPSQLRLTALKAVSNLRQMYSPVKAEGDARVFQKNLFNLNSLLIWLAQNRVKVNDHMVAYSAEAQPEQTDQEVKYVVDTEAHVKIWREGLIDFLKTLRRQAADSGNVYFQELVGKVIEDANAHRFLDTGLEADEPAKEEKKEPETKTERPAASARPEETGAPGVPGAGAQQVAYVQSLQESLKEGGSEDLMLPFDLTTDAVNLTRFNQFANQLYSLMRNPSFRQEMAEYFGMLGTVLGAINNGIQNFRTTAAGTPVAEGGFTLSANDNADDFANLVGDYAKARNLLTVLSPLVLSLSNAINTLRGSATLRSMIGDDILRQQVQRGRDYVNRINGFITYINVKAGRTK